MKMLLLLSLILFSSFLTVAQTAELEELETILPIKASVGDTKISSVRFAKCSAGWTKTLTFRYLEPLVTRYKFLFEDLDEKQFRGRRNTDGTISLVIKASKESIVEELFSKDYPDGKLGKVDEVYLTFENDKDYLRVLVLFQSATEKCKYRETEKTVPKVKPKTRKKKP